MTDMPAARIVGAAEVPYTRHPADDVSTESLLADAFVRVLADAGVDRGSVDGLGVASFMLPPDRAIDLAWKLGVHPRWMMDDGNGGASGIQLLQHAMRAIEAGDPGTRRPRSGGAGAGTGRRRGGPLSADGLRELSEPYRSVLILREIQGLKYREIADTLEMPLNTVRVHLHRGRRKLRERLHEDYADAQIQ